MSEPKWLGHMFQDSGIRFKGGGEGACMHETWTAGTLRVCGRERGDHGNERDRYETPRPEEPAEPKMIPLPHAFVPRHGGNRCGYFMSCDLVESEHSATLRASTPAPLKKCNIELTTAHGERPCELAAGHSGCHKDGRWMWKNAADPQSVLVIPTPPPDSAPLKDVREAWAIKRPDGTFFGQEFGSHRPLVFDNWAEPGQGKMVRVRVTVEVIE